MNIVLFGPPGAGKSTIAKHIAQHYSIPHISTGDIFRDHIKRKTQLGKQIEDILASGDLIPDNLTTDLVKSRLAEADVMRGYILDGYPRTLGQANWLDITHRIAYYLVFDISETILVERLSGRRVHPPSGRVYHITYDPPKVADQDDETGEALVQREDDMPEKIVKRFQVYTQKTHPILEFIGYKKECVHIDASKAMDVVLKQTMKALGARR